MTFLFLILASLSARAELEPGVWDQLQSGGNTQVEAKIKGFEVRGNTVLVTIQKHGETKRETLKMCTEIANPAENDYFRSEEQRAAFFSNRMQSIREARQTQETVRLSYHGPWSPCLESVALLPRPN